MLAADARPRYPRPRERRLTGHRPHRKSPPRRSSRPPPRPLPRPLLHPRRTGLLPPPQIPRPPPRRPLRRQGGRPQSPRHRLARRIAWTDMEILNDPAGKPLLRLTGAAPPTPPPSALPIGTSPSPTPTTTPPPPPSASAPHPDTPTRRRPVIFVVSRSAES